MQNTVTGLLDDYPDVVTADADLAAGEAQRQGHLGRVRIAARKAEQTTPALTADKIKEKDRVIAEILKPLGRVHAWANRTGNAEAQRTADVTFTDLDAVGDAFLIGRMEELMTFLRGVIASVPTVPAAQLDTLDDDIDGLSPLLSGPRGAIVDWSAAIVELKREIGAARDVLKDQHDKLVLSFGHASPATPLEVRQRELFDRWDGARTVVDGATTHKPAAAPAAAAPGGTAAPK